LALAGLVPVGLASVLLPGLLDLATMFQGGIGGGAIECPSLAFWAGMRYLGAGRFGYGSSVAAVRDHDPDLALTVTSFGDPQLAVATPRRAWVALYHWSLMVVLAMACAILHRAIEPRGRMSSWLRLSRRVRSGGHE
jgi:hypothetical protein